MALSFIGKPISLISHSDVRYRGILAGIDPQASTIQLSNVYSMGTESRRPPNQFIAPVQDPYAYIIFRASEVKDLAVDEPAANTGPSVHDDPAVLGASAPIPKTATSVPTPPYQSGQPVAPGPVPQQQQPQAQQPQQAAAAQATPSPQNTNQNANSNRRPNPLHTAAASLETVERALGDLRVSNNHNQTQHQGHGHGGHHGGGGRGGRRGHHNGSHHGTGRDGNNAGAATLKVPTVDFDFQGSNAKFDKAAHSPAGTVANDGTDDGQTTTTGDDSVSNAATAEKEAAAPAYNPQKSFFDSLSSSSASMGGNNNNANANGMGGGAHQGNSRGRRGGGGPGGAGRNRREEEREKNVATFGEPGGVGLLGPGGYVGGWGGYGRRGGRPRRGGGGGRGQAGVHGQQGQGQAQQAQARG